MEILLIAGVAVVLLVALLSSVFSADARTKRALAEAPLESIGKVQEGAVVRVKGRVRPVADMIQAPLTGRYCVHYVAVVEERHKGKNSTYWSEVAREVKGVDFEVQDVTGEIHVQSQGLQAAITLDKHTKSGSFDDATEAEQKFLARMNESSTGLLGFNRTLRYTEGALEAGEEITVLGQARYRDLPGGGRVLILGPTPHGSAMATDDRDVVLGR